MTKVAVPVVLVFVAKVVFGDLDIWSRYNQPYHAIKQLQHYHGGLSQLSASDLLQVKKNVEEFLNPLEIFQKGPNKYQISEKCGNQTLYLLEVLSSNSTSKLWAEQMVDAFGKPGPGILQGRVRWLGDYSECVSIGSIVPPSSLQPDAQFKAQYCAVGVLLTNTGPVVSIPVGIDIGVCVPSGCSDVDVLSLMQAAVGRFNANLSAELTAVCLDPDQPFSDGAIAVIAVFAAFGALCFLGTTIDCWFRHVTNGDDDDVSPVNGNEADFASDAELILPKSKLTDRRPGAIGSFLMCFSFYTNGSKLLSTSQHADSLTSLNGIRVITISWIILGHTFVFCFAGMDNFFVVASWTKRFTFQAIVNATVSVDTFFLISGLLSCYLCLKQFEKKKTSLSSFLKSLPIMYIHRYIRLTPAYAAMIVFFTFVTPYLIDGPLKSPSNVQDVYCLNNSWSNLLYITNFVDPLYQCTAWGWYLSNDFQFYIITPVIAYILYRLPTFGIILTIISIVTSCGAAAGVTYKYDLGIGLLTPRLPSQAGFNVDEVTHYYYTPWTRYQSYGVGIFYGYILLKVKGKTIPKVLNLFLWAFSAALMMLVIYGPYDMVSGGHIASMAETAAYNGFSRTAWAMGVGYILLSCCTGSGGWVNGFLSWSGFVPLARLTYCTYLIHPIIIIIAASSQEALIIWKDWTVVFMYAGFLTLGHATAVVFSLVFEAPFMLIDKNYITGRLMKSSS